MYCLETRELSYKFSPEETALHGIDLQVVEGSIYGFLGPNGAGKTTTLRLILGLLKRQQGEISIFGLPFEQNRVAILKQVGSLIESPSLYGHLTATENLTLLQKIHRCPSKRIEDVLDLVGLSHTGNKQAGQFSLGMKQRLSIAIALLHNPALLILDEPTNGLDPNGIIDVRELLMRLNRDQGITIIVSSHLLAEVEKLVTHVGIISKGRLMFQGPLDELKRKQQQSRSIVIETDDAARTARILRDHALSPRCEAERVIIPPIPKEAVATLNHQLVNHGIAVYAIHSVKTDLETIFIDLINT